ncbi:peroxiredoxin family protein [Robertmurraya korlensis]|uniref:peroxiredoxin family protein n=1 Tax=Robertmurraya korlensis TaxID=519977 RepID=UPI00082578AB|nr:redoxin domain-containing protein [Robertmurraya korlensis]
MLKKLTLTIIALSLMTITLTHTIVSASTDNLPGLRVGEAAPDFELKTLEGKTVKLSDYRGKKVIVNFWATWCPPCKAEMPDIQKYYNDAGENVEILAVNIDPQYDVQKFVREANVTFPVLLDSKDEVNTLYRILTIPTTYFIDQDGIIRSKYLSVMTVDTIREHMENM